MEFYIQSRVYRILLNKDGTASPFLQQENNAIKVTDFNVTIKQNTTIEEILKEVNPVARTFIGKNHFDDKLVPYEGPTPVDFMVMKGICINHVKPDLNKPIVVDDNKTDIEALSEAAKVKEHPETFVYIMPIFPDSAWDFTITSAPEGSVESAHTINGVDVSNMKAEEVENYLKELLENNPLESK